MMKTSFTSLITFLFLTVFCNSLNAQIEKGEFINVSSGIGLCYPDDETEMNGSGFYAQGEYVLNLNNWFGVRPYAGVIIASGDSDEVGMEEYEVKSNAFLLGAKVRVAAPIPYFAPFIEFGLGMSAGSFRTYTPLTDVKKDGVLMHVPFSIGAAVGKKHKLEFKFTYYYHSAAEQFSGAAAVGFSFPLNRN